MKYIFPLFLSVVIFGCKQMSDKRVVSKSISSEADSNLVKYRHKLDSIGTDSINISADPENPIFYKTADLKDIIKHRPELISEYADDPGIEYERRKLSVDELDDQKGVDYSFASEVGEDGYYAVYAYFLRFRNGDKPYETQRARLIRLYTDINSVFQKLMNGGTYFGHQETRILGDAEYAISLYPKDKNDDYYNKPYNIGAQKQLFISSLNQFIDDELKANNLYLGKDKADAKAELSKTVEEIDSLITGYFYLKMAQRYRYEKY